MALQAFKTPVRLVLLCLLLCAIDLASCKKTTKLPASKKTTKLPASKKSTTKLPVGKKPTTRTPSGKPGVFKTDDKGPIPPSCKHTGKKEIEEFLKKHEKSGGAARKGSTTVVPRAVWEQSGLYQGDIIPLSKTGNSGALGDSSRWPNGVIPYLINPSFSETETNQILQAFMHITSKTCITFHPWKKGNESWIYITNESRGCWSFVGMMGGGGQFLNLGPNCALTHVVIHELLHAVGFWHQQSATNRDDYITVVKENIKRVLRLPRVYFWEPNQFRWFLLIGMEVHFEKYPPTMITDFGVCYDYGSIMHYDANAFSANGKPTIIAKQPNATIGGAAWMTAKDIRKVQRMYNCPGGQTKWKKHEGKKKDDNKEMRTGKVRNSHYVQAVLRQAATSNASNTAAGCSIMRSSWSLGLNVGLVTAFWTLFTLY